MTNLSHTPAMRLFNGILLSLIVVFCLFLLSSGAAQALTPDIQANLSAPGVISTPPLQKDTLIVGSEQDYPPFATGMTDATADGFTVELWKAVATQEGLNYTIRVLPFHQILDEFKAGKIDVLINLAKSDQRQQFADFSVPHVVVHGAIFVRKGESSIHSEQDLADKSIIVISADLAHDYAVSQKLGKQLILVNNAEEGMRLLASGKHDAMLISKLAGMQTLQALGLTNVVGLDTKVGFSQKFSFAVQEGQSDLLSKINEGLALTKSNETYNTLYEKWFGVYEVKESGPQDFLKYIAPIIVPIILIFIGVMGYFLYRRQIEREIAQNVLQKSEAQLRALVQTIPDLIWLKDVNGVYLSCNSMFERFFGAKEADIIGKTDYDFVEKGLADFFRENDRKAMEANKATANEEWLTFADGGYRGLFEAIKTPLIDNNGQLIGVLGIARDITERKVAEITISAAALYARSLLEASLDPLVTISTKGVITDVNTATELVTGVSRENLIGSDFADYFTEPEKARGAYLQAFLQGAVTDYPLAIRHVYGKVTDVLYNASVYRDSKGDVVGVFAAARDVTERKAAEFKLRMLSTAIEQGPTSVVIANLKAEVEYVNSRFTAVTGYSQAEAVGVNPRVLQSGLTDKLVYGVMWDKLTQGQTWIGEFVNKRKNGEVYYEESYISPVRDDRGDITHYVAVKLDITERKKMEEQVRQLAFYDALTKLPNRRLLNDRLSQAISACKRSHRYGALMFLDLDNFKPLNDTHGHVAGDLLLIEVARRLERCMREMDTVARFGGDEFVIMLTELDVDQAQSKSQAEVVAEKIHAILAEPYVLTINDNGQQDVSVEHHCTASIGVTLFGNGLGSQDDIMKWADSAMYQAKEAGRNLIRFHDANVLNEVEESK
ncbi:MAG: PAS domain S-box protein [Pseudomonadota bacterium]